MDTQTLSEREAKLRKELNLIEKLKGIADDPDAIGYLRGLINGTPATPEETTDKPRYSVKREVKNSGARRQVLINLLTGPTSKEDLASAMKWDYKLVARTLDSMVRVGLAADQQGRFFLTPPGKAQAVWFQTHPGFKVYKPNTK